MIFVNCLGICSYRVGCFILGVNNGGSQGYCNTCEETRWTRIAYAVFWPLLPLVRAIAPGAVISTEELGRAMIRAAREGGPKRVLESRDLRALGAL